MAYAARPRNRSLAGELRSGILTYLDGFASRPGDALCAKGGRPTIRGRSAATGRRIVIETASGKRERLGGESGDARRERSTQRILVVDDNRDAADSLGLLLESLGCETRVSYDGPSALSDFEDYLPDIVFLDIGMPGMDGYEVAQRMRASPRDDRFLLVAVTGWGQEEHRRRVKAAGFDHHLVKPVDLGSLQEMLALE